MIDPEFMQEAMLKTVLRKGSTYVPWLWLRDAFPAPTFYSTPGPYDDVNFNDHVRDFCKKHSLVFTFTNGGYLLSVKDRGRELVPCDHIVGVKSNPKRRSAVGHPRLLVRQSSGLAVGQAFRFCPECGTLLMGEGLPES